MSAPLKLDADALRKLATTLDELSEITRRTGVEISPHTGLQLSIGDTAIDAAWDATAEAYILQDRIGD